MRRIIMFLCSGAVWAVLPSCTASTVHPIANNETSGNGNHEPLEKARTENIKKTTNGNGCSMEQNEAVALAERFVVDNGYTSAERGIGQLEATAWGVRCVTVEERASFWEVVFRFRQRPRPRDVYRVAPDGTRELDPAYIEDRIGSIVVVHPDGQLLKYHLDGRLENFSELRPKTGT